MSATEYYSHTTYPATGAAGSSASMRSELELVEAGFGKLPDLSGNGSKIVAVNSGGTALESVSSLTVAQGGTGRATSTTAYALLAAGTTATGAHQTLAAGATTEILVGGGASALPVWTTATGTGAPVRATNCALVTPDLGTPSALVGTNISGTAASLTAGNVTTNANLTGHVTSVGNAAVLGSFTMAQLDAAVSDGNVIYSGQALGTPSSGTLTNCSGTAASLTAGNVTTNANLTGHVTSSGNAAVLGSFTFAQLNTAVSDAEVARTDAANTFTGTQTFSNLIAAAAGSVGAPSIYMTGYATTGWYNIGANNWGFAVSGSKVLDIASTGLTVVGISTVTQSKVTVNTNNLYEAVTLTNSSNTSSGMQILTKNGYGNLVSIDMQQVDNGTGADDGVMNIKIATNSTLATVASVSSTGLAVTGTLSSTGLFAAPRFAWTGDAAGTQGVVATDSTFNKIISASIAYGISTNNAGGLDIMANQDSQAIRMYAGTANNASPPAIATVSSTGLAVTGTVTATDNFVIAVGKKLYYSATAYVTPDDNVTGAVLAGTSAASIKVNGSNVAVATSAGLAVTGEIGASGTITSTASGSILQRTGASTAAQIIRLANTTGDFYLGIESSVAGSYFPTSSAYASVLASTQPVQTIVGGVKITDTNAAGLAVTGTLSSTGDYKIAGTGIYNAIATNTSLGLFADANAYAGIKAYGSSHATKANVTELLAGTGVVVGTVSSTGLAVTGTLNTATTTALSWGGGVVAGHILGTLGTGSSLFINTEGLNTSYASGLAVDGSYSSLVSTVNIRALGTYSGGGYEAKLAFFTSSDTTQGQRMLLSSTGLAVTGALSATGNISASSVSLPDGNVVTWGAGATTYIQGNQASAYMNFCINSVNRMALTSAGLAVTGTLSATGTSSLARIDQSNGSIDFASLGNGSTSWQIGTVTAGKPLDLFIGGSVIATVSTTGLAVTGDISVSTKTPASAAAAGVAGTITWDADYLYVCTATNTWKRVAIATW
jgi:hypothetical protein